MRIKSIFMLLAGVCIAVSCGREQFLPDLEQEITGVEQSDKLTMSDDFATIEESEESGGREKCSDSCSTKPGDISDFKDALNQMRYERTGDSETAAISHCEQGEFNTCSTWMVMQSSGSRNHRSELKYPGNLDFDEEHIMRAEMIVENAPFDDMGKDELKFHRGLTVAQIHNRSQAPSSTRPLLRVDIIDDCVRVVIAQSPKTNVTTSDVRCVLDFSDGDRLYIKLAILGDGKRFHYYIKNKSTNKTVSASPTLPEDWEDIDSKYYFKTGAYAQVRTDSGDPVPRVSYKKLSLSLSGVSSSSSDVGASTNSTSTSSNNSNSNTVILRKRNAMGYALDGGNGSANRQNVKIWSYNSNNVNQQWIEINRGNGFYSYKKKNTNHCLDGNSGGRNGQNVHLWTCNSGNQNQHFKKVSMGNGYYRLQKRNASGYSIDGKGGGSNNQNVHMWSNNNGNHNQHWYFEYK